MTFESINTKQEEHEPQDALEKEAEIRLGKEVLQEATHLCDSILREMKIRILDLSREEASQEKVEEYVDMWREFVIGLFARTSSGNLASPDHVKTAIEGATAIMQAEPTEKGRKAAQKIIEALSKRYRTRKLQ